MAITGINNSSYTSYYASGYKNTVKKAACDIQKTKENSQVSFSLLFPLCYIVPSVFTNSDKGKYKGKKNL
jgi:hypothetical protein